jgi:hypothetical protein
MARTARSLATSAFVRFIALDLLVERFPKFERLFSSAVLEHAQCHENNPFETGAVVRTNDLLSEL